MSRFNPHGVEVEQSEDTLLAQGNLRVIESECKFSADRRTAEITIASVNPDFPRAIEELQDMKARGMAMAYAGSRGVTDPSINGMVRPYAVNEDSVRLERVSDGSGKPMNPRHPKMQPTQYRADVKVTNSRVGR